MNIGNAPLVIVGAGHAGGRAALTLRAEGYSGRLVLIGDETHPPYERPLLSKGLLSGAQALADYSLSDSAQLLGLEIEHLAGRAVQYLDTQGHRLQLADGGWLPYSRLLLATGGRARRLPNVPGRWRNVLYLRTHDEAMALRAVLVPETRVVIIGGGFIGLEVAASARALGCRVSLLEAGPRLAGRVLPQRLSDALLTLHRGQGVDVHLGVAIEAVEGAGQAEAVRLADGRRLPCDLLLVGIGMQPNSELASAAGLEVGQGIRVDAQLRSSAPDIYAAGDVCEFRLHPQGPFQRQETWRNAEAQGRHAALNLLGAEQPFEVIPGFWSDQYDWGLQTVGVIAGAEPSVSRPLPGGAFLLFYLDAERRLQGACAWGPGNSGARDIKLCERLIASRIPLDGHLLADSGVPLKPLLRS